MIKRNTLAGNKSEGEGSYVTFRKLKCRILLTLSFVLITSFSFIYFDFEAFRRIPTSTEIPTCTREVTLKPNRSSSSSSPWYGEALPSCTELMRQPMYADGSFLTNRNTTQIVWRKRHDGSKELTVPFTCYLTRYTPEQAGKCLKNKNLFFVGDSLTRYQFLSLAYFLEHKKWPMRFNAGLQPCLDHIDENGNPTCSKKEEPSVCSENDFVDIGGWKSYYQAMGGGTGGSVFHGRMESQSIRSGKRFPIVDTMQYTSSDKYGEGNGRTKLSAYMELGRSGMEPFHGFNFTGCGYNATCTYTPERYAQNEKRVSNSDFDWEYPNIVTGFGPNGTSFHAQHQDTNYIFYNRGIWGAIQIDKAEKMMSAMYEMTGGDEGRRVSNNRCFFRSTTANFQTNTELKHLKDLESGPVRDIVRRSGCEYFDISFVTEEFSRIEDKSYEQRSTFLDQVHYTPWVYEELNNLLLNVLCNSHDF